MSEETRPPSDITTTSRETGRAWEFEQQNSAALKSGARSPRVTAPIAERVHKGLAVAEEWADSGLLERARQSLAESEAVLAAITAYIREHGPLDSKGQPRAATTLFIKTSRLCMEQRTHLPTLAKHHLGVLRDLDRLQNREASMQADLARAQAWVAANNPELAAPATITEPTDTTDDPTDTDGGEA